MLTQLTLEESVRLYQANVNKTLNAAKQVTLPNTLSLSFSTYQLNTVLIKKLAKILPTGGKSEDASSEFIYIFSLSEQNKIKAKELILPFDNFRQKQRLDSYNGKKNLCQINRNACESRTLYVGRSYKPRERFKQHLLDSKSGTYAIHFAMWANELDALVDFHLYQFRGIGDRVIQVIEDGLWDNLNPLLGKRGER